MESHKPCIHESWLEIKKRYSITKFLGKGAYGEVFKVKERSTNEVYAIKRI